MPENFVQSSAYAFGMIQGIKLLLQKMTERINNAPMMYRKSLREELQMFVSIVNEFPTISEKGMFFIDPVDGVPVFRWVPENKNELLEKLLTD